MGAPPLVQMSSGVACDDEVKEIFNEVKMKKTHPWVTFHIQDKKIIKIDKKGEKLASFEENWKAFRDELLKNVGGEPRYGIVDIDYTSDDGRPQNKLTFVVWSPDATAPVKSKMLYSSSKDAIKKKLTGIMKELQANGEDDL